MMAWLMKQLPNMITLLRVVLSCLLSFYILSRFGSMLIPIIIILVIFLTDFLDGKIARLYGNTSHFGAAFDVLADLFYIVAIYIVLYYYHVLPLWFLFIILFKFIEFVVTSLFLKKISSGKSIFVFDFIGRLVAVLFYIIPIMAYVSFMFSQPIYFFTVHVFIYIITFMALVSSLYRLWKWVKVLKISMEQNHICYLKYKYKNLQKQSLEILALKKIEI
ncbi:MAG: CDP-alcohol phosphatidyltransferase [Clostridia bacterium]|uniref:CDP-alcohol phosphatidyltransferase family protein n=1 Tax=Petroclostridium xylanilyticum TaxID=1792311 RepID=UPI001FA90AEA|nr:CDP-alcohol phosphatidyltransferase family protein [Petroclostridium xylanilyticum]MBZ4646013.1 CDP-alcohol phosphatidyltransferase [Clostridia bacterium]